MTKFETVLIEQYALSPAQANKVCKRYIKDKILKIDRVSGDYSVIHGAFMDKEVIQRALES